MSEVRYTIAGADTLTATMNRVWQMIQRGLQAGPVEIVLTRPHENRTQSQNRKMWPCLTDISRQVDWYGEHLSPEDWKDVFTAALRKQRAVPGIDGGFVVLGLRTSQMQKRVFSDLLEIIQAFGAEHGVRWSDPAERAFEQYIQEVVCDSA